MAAPWASPALGGKKATKSLHPRPGRATSGNSKGGSDCSQEVIPGRSIDGFSVTGEVPEGKGASP